MAVTNTLKSKHCPINTTKFNYEIQSSFSLFNVILYQVVVLILDFYCGNWSATCSVNMFILIYKIQFLPETFVDLQKLFTYMCQCVLTFKCCPVCINIDFDRQILENFKYRDNFTFPYCKLQRYLNYSCKATLTDVHKLLCNVFPNLVYITGTVSGKLTYWQQKVSVWHYPVGG